MNHLQFSATVVVNKTSVDGLMGRKTLLRVNRMAEQLKADLADLPDKKVRVDIAAKDVSIGDEFTGEHRWYAQHLFARVKTADAQGRIHEEWLTKNWFGPEVTKSFQPMSVFRRRIERKVRGLVSGFGLQTDMSN